MKNKMKNEKLNLFQKVTRIKLEYLRGWKIKNGK